ncbi:hypothetical protein [Bradyrhizobium sp. JYMT SZCCT0180]|uniref:hypothetical protein n=1 Tax=Bradyrhizobium sp. JYMT SZCCT0180 TaxID=2807666 RepID=UPI001BA5A0F1|nr:hypothetical protein [Bradyrhizobium sp. JYMT SZCCT0180]MBR1210955.1 hypothetical protein [Bradyrhizobium sp. JYMT SZCCT0180]
MTIGRESLLRRLETLPHSESVDLAKLFLTSTDEEPTLESASRISASEAIRLWGTRLKNVEYTKKPIQGVEWLLMRLETLRPGDELDQFSLVGREFHGILFFSVEGQEFMGLMLVETENAGDRSLKT